MLPLALYALLAGCIDTLVPAVKEDVGDSGVFCEDISEEPLTAGFADALETEGCRYTLQAVDDLGTVALLLDVPAFADVASGVPASTTYTLPDDAVRLEVNVGCDLDQELCGSTAETGFVARAYTASAGIIGVEATPDGEEADAVVTFTDVTLDDGSGESVVLDAALEVRLYAVAD